MEDTTDMFGNEDEVYQVDVPLTLPETQVPQSQDYQQVSQQPEIEEIWGNLNPLLSPLTPFSLSMNEYKIGREGDIKFTLENMVSRYYPLISKSHFIITKEMIGNDTIVFLKDVSRNGTYVNSELVGEGRKVVLDCDDKIGVVRSTGYIYQFHTTCTYEKVHLPEELKKKYAVIKELGKGACGEVKLIICKRTHQRFALKIIKKTTDHDNDNDLVIQEVKILQALKHPFVVDLIEILDKPDKLYIVLELMEGGELFEKIRGTAGFPEHMAKFIFYQIVDAVKYLHQHRITHRDLKPENILFKSNSEYSIVKISDFGLSKMTNSKTILKTLCGTPLYVAPEILECSGTCGPDFYTNKVDVWSLGLVLYVMLTGCHPFSTKNKKISLRDQILNGRVTFPDENFRYISKEAIDLIKRMIKVKPTERISIDKVLESRWLNDESIIIKINELKDVNSQNPLINHLNISNHHDNNTNSGEIPLKRSRLNN